MTRDFNKNRFIFIASLIGLAAMSRLLPHPPNFTAVGAMALFGGAMIGSRVLAILVPLIALFLSDLLLGFDIHTFAGVYIGFVLMAGIGLWMGNKRISFAKTTGAAVVGSLVFFIVSNGWDWVGNPMYSQDLTGLVSAYVMGLAFYTQDVFGSFFVNSLMANVLFSWALFGVYWYVEQNAPSLVGQAVPVKSDSTLDGDLIRK